LNTIITEFLDYARPRSNLRERTDIGALLNETIALFKNSSNFRSGIEIRCDLAPRLAVTGDSQRLRQVFWNLLINAAQAIRDGGAIGVSAAPDSDDLSDDIVIRISDTGTGIAKEHLENIFDPFFTTKTDGTGLGLAIVYRIMEDHGGSIDVKSEQGKGTIVTLRLPSEEQPARTAR
jgi:two-component system sensor histidine kinase PilS (NtrC family)